MQYDRESRNNPAWVVFSSVAKTHGGRDVRWATATEKEGRDAKEGPVHQAMYASGHGLDVDRDGRLFGLTDDRARREREREPRYERFRFGRQRILSVGDTFGPEMSERLADS